MAVRLDIVSTGFTVRFRGIDLVAGCGRDLFVPFERVVGTRVLARADALASSPRLASPGLWWPGRLRTGAWGIGERRQLWAVRRGAELVVVYLSGRPFHRVVVEVEEPRWAHLRLEAALRRSKETAPRRSLGGAGTARRRDTATDRWSAR
ncbi:hypothetical protein PHK61_24300 [Actinomycetospora lutea]|uniref:hypothetical protein n=1 Tax=Actinomycetospora lutea TaxID=663604 RepID=UPI002365922B|nr:hypothetical protein [Actinomycetospora lutea]MDD7941547.1 hypothetical protein [Actinomycetospora lutea]